MIELINVFLTTDAGRVCLSSPRDRCNCDAQPCECSPNAHLRALEHFLGELDAYIDVRRSTFYAALRDRDIFVYRCERGAPVLEENEFFVFDRRFAFVEDDPRLAERKVSAVVFLVTETLDACVVPREGVAVSAVASNHRYYDGMF
ncbi:conserved hypothetical pox protein [Squirrelpox virus]|uniref:Conserved hypothetical pox protein n=1 Tax=Squirrelpox virus TaxID=240426 RepID=U3UB94_9POXV|nr:conserved hypothetical pox protein [Squirrelpox virus]CCD83217.1 conserved hypothetical pox protein [Squirrelpox virus]